MTTKLQQDGMRERLLAAALRVLGKHGLRRLTQPQVAKEAGVRQSHLTYYFPHRSDLVAAVARHYLLSVGEEVARVTASSSSERIPKALIDLAATLVKNRRRSRILLGLLVASEEDKALKKQLIDGVLAVRGVVEGVLGVPEGHPDAALLEAVLLGLGVQYLLFEGHPREADTDRSLTALAKMVKKRRGTLHARARNPKLRPVDRALADARPRRISAPFDGRGDRSVLRR